MKASPNFAFLRVHDLHLVRLGTQAERYLGDDPNTCLIKLRQFGETLAQMVAASVGLYQSPGESQVDLLRRLDARGAIPTNALNLFHQLRKTGNQATHASYDSQRAALSHLKYAHLLGVWYHRSYGGQVNFNPGPFLPPPDSEQETAAMRAELERLRAEVEAQRLNATEAEAIATREAEARQIAEEQLQQLEAEREALAAEMQAKLAAMQATAIAQPQPQRQQAIDHAQRIGQQLELDERETRRLIDQQLRDVGWDADTEELRYSQGVRPQKGRYLAIAEYPTTSGPADYALFAGLQLVGVVEAKRQSSDVAGAVEQAKRYSRDVRLEPEAAVPGSPWGTYQVPFVFATNGREFLEQLRTKSGIWFCDVRRPQNLSRPLKTWYSPQDLIDTLAQDIDAAQTKLGQEAFHYDFPLRDYQRRAIQTVEATLATDRRTLLVAMATGTGKTKTSIALVYRLLKTKRFRRILFLVDRTALGEQTADAFKETRMESLQTFADIFDIKELKDTEPDRDTKVHISTVQGMVKRLLYPADDTPPLSAGQYDCIVVDECHRGYLLDREMSEAELTFRDLNDYVSKYRQVLEFFDAVKIGLTATPALHTKQIFGAPVFKYGYREAVIDGWLIDYEPPVRITTALAEDGIRWKAGDEVGVYNPQSGTVDLANTPDEIHIEVDQFHRRVITESFNQVVCQELTNHIDPSLPEKTLIFCVTDHHADIVVDQLKRAYEEAYGGIDDEAIAKITGTSDKPLQLIRRFRNEVNPKIAVTVDLLTTGVDVPPICNLVFIRRVNSRILYEQMMGRATRPCDDIGKTVFRVFDAVNLYENIASVTDMKPVVVNPKISFEQLVTELDTVTQANTAPHPDAVGQIMDQLIAKLHRKRAHLSDAQEEAIAHLANMPVENIAAHLRNGTPEEAANWLRQRRDIARLLDQRDGGRRPMLVSDHPDELRRVEYGYGNASRPEDYLDSFQQFLETHLNEIPALLVVTQRPRDLSRAQLKELRLALDAEGFTDANLQAAWRDTTNEDIAASIIGFIRHTALGDPLIPYEERVDRALRSLLSSRSWTVPQRRWLERIGQQLKVEYIVDRDALDSGAFKTEGGFKRINKIFNGQIETILTDLHDRLWQSAS